MNKICFDYPGDKLFIIDCETVEILHVEVFEAILTCSQFTNVEPVMIQHTYNLSIK